MDKRPTFQALWRCAAFAALVLATLAAAQGVPSYTNTGVALKQVPCYALTVLGCTLRL